MAPLLILQALVNGLIIGSIYALIACGLTLIFGVMNIINVAHGEFMMLAMYACYFLYFLWGIDPYLSILIVFPLSFAFGILIFRIFIKPIFDNPDIEEPMMNQVLVTIGLSLVFENGMLGLFSADYRTINLKYAEVTIHLGKVAISFSQLIVLFCTVAVILALYWLLRSTDWGRFIRAVTENQEAALLMGVNVPRIYLFSFGLGIGILGIAGPLLVPIYYTYPSIGVSFLLTAFVVVVLGGMGSFIGALVGGLIIGIVESLGATFMPGSMAPVLTFSVFILLLLFKPEGLFGVRAS